MAYILAQLCSVLVLTFVADCMHLLIHRPSPSLLQVHTTPWTISQALHLSSLPSPWHPAQVWHVCEADGRQHSFLCPNGTVFSQRLLTCDWWYNVHCGGDGDLHLTSIHDTGLQESYRRASDVYGKKMTYKPIKAYSPNHEAPVTPKRQSEVSGFTATNLGQNQQGHSPLSRIRVLNSGYGVFPTFQLEGKFKTQWFR